ncbi:hypothetical protein EXIGLDRAFT_764511 [Exidia glandulosa HHB12029]|uniref:Uncharacterized protein n=1 Tax=Exidia glandulosa HHB12029 TaxID=1314781 RepID=A0A166B2R8_EXIGL|nr:hypothetical protein EXIGLDRAFT_764511 [Exidia glandulosa HHB12029]
MFLESERNDANANPKHAAFAATTPKPSSTSEYDADEKYEALEPQHEAKYLTPRGGFAGIQKYFGYYKPSWDYVDVLCSRYWRYKDASFIFYRGAVLSHQHMHSQFVAAATKFDRKVSLPEHIERLREQGFSTVLNRLGDVCGQWKLLKHAIQESSIYLRLYI